ncbi:ATP-binding protein [Patescibacteria group bacterium]|nr:ATP-binding protein [Patescibacteria group bacterium]MBU1931853.1 ATP-binding protein [Patescibacteria group bacterium]
MIKRTLTDTIKNNLKPGFINIVYGPRRVGKTVLLQQLTKNISRSDILWFNGDTQETRDALSTTSEVALSHLVDKAKVVVVDEAQRIANIGLSLKILIDTFPKKTYFVTGSSSLMLARGIQESLTGRAIKYRLFPLSTQELAVGLKTHQKTAILEDQLLFGGYPYIQHLKNVKDKRDYLKSIVEDYLFKDVLELKEIVSPENLKKLAILLAFQIGSEVSLNELAGNLGVDIKTVRRYLSLFKQSFVIFELGAFSKNLRKEVVKSKKYYFWDLGIRNALIDQFLPLDSRIDIGQLWENFLAVERFKVHEYQRDRAQYYFWRTYDQAEIDWLEIRGEKISAYEFKWQSNRLKKPKVFLETYPKAKLKLVNQGNFQDFLRLKK